jgi:hypothetical protein
VPPFASRIPGLTRQLGFLLSALPVGLYFWYVDRFGVNVPYEDTWNGTLPLLQALSRGQLQLAALWAPHNENRMLVAYLVNLAVDSSTQMNQRADMLVSACLLSAALAVGCLLAARTLRLSSLWLVPTALIWMGLVQYENSLWAFQLAWMLIVFLTLATLALIELVPERWWGFSLAVLLALLASYSSLQGLLVWPLGLLYGVAVGWRPLRAGTWVVLAVVATAVYGYHFGAVQPPPQPLLALREPGQAIDFLALLVGQMYPFHRALLGGFTVLVSLLAAALMVARGWDRYRLPLALIAMGLLFDLMVTEGRLSLGLVAAGASRYTTYNLILLAGMLLGAAAALRSGVRAPAASRLLAAAIFALALIQIAGDIPTGLHQGQLSYQRRSAGASLLLHLRRATDAELAQDLFAPSGQYVRVWTPVLERHHWSLFAR